METFGLFAMIGTVSFALQGGMIAMEKKYDLFAVYLFGLITAFGGGAIRTILIGGSDYDLWNQPGLFWTAIISITLILMFPKIFQKSRWLWGNFLDGVGIIAFAIQGSITAMDFALPVSAVVVSAMITATGGGIIRDLMSQRRPIVLGEVIYGLWIFLVGLIIGMGWADTTLEIYAVFVIFTILRTLSFLYDWKIPYRHYRDEQ